MTAIAFRAKSAKTLKSGDVSLVVHVDKSQAEELLKYFNKPDSEGALVALADKTQNYESESTILWRSQFFCKKSVWVKIGSDSKFLEWLRLQPCAKTRSYGYESDPVVAAHVRRVANGSGTGIKPDYSAIPLLNSLHLLQHAKGETAVAPQDWWDSQRMRHVHLWA